VRILGAGESEEQRLGGQMRDGMWDTQWETGVTGALLDTPGETEIGVDWGVKVRE